MAKAGAAFLPIRAAPFCGAKRRRQDPTCRRPAGWGTDHAGAGRCKLHGGTTPTHEFAAQKMQARQTAQLFAIPREVHPLDGLMEEYWRTAGLVDSYEAMCAGLLPEEVVWGTASEEKTEAEASDGGDGSLAPAETKTRKVAVVNVWVKLFNEERKRFSDLGEAILRLDLDSRKVELTQTHVAAMVALLLSPDLGLTDDQRRVAARMLRAMDQRTAIEGSVVA